jgi:hypothetical protein
MRLAAVVSAALAAVSWGCGARTGLLGGEPHGAQPGDDGGQSTAPGSTQTAVDAGLEDGGVGVVLYGGAALVEGIQSGLSDTWVFDGAAWQQSQISNGPAERIAPVATTLATHAILFGGSAGPDEVNVVAMNDTWAFDGTSWSALHPSSSPPPRYLPVIGTLGPTVVLFGGQDAASSVFLGDTWTLDGTSWSQASLASSPPARWGAVMAPLGQHLVLFGGADGPYAANFFDDTWTFDGASWTQVIVPSSPPARVGAMMAALGHEVVLFGGLSPGSSTGPVTNDTWTFDGATWTQLDASASAPPPRFSGMMVTLGSELVLFGGVDGQDTSAAMNDTWTFDGAGWAQVNATSRPPARTGAAMALFRSP